MFWPLGRCWCLLSLKAVSSGQGAAERGHSTVRCHRNGKPIEQCMDVNRPDCMSELQRSWKGSCCYAQLRKWVTSELKTERKGSGRTAIWTWTLVKITLKHSNLRLHILKRLKTCSVRVARINHKSYEKSQKRRTNFMRDLSLCHSMGVNDCNEPRKTCFWLYHRWYKYSSAVLSLYKRCELSVRPHFPELNSECGDQIETNHCSFNNSGTSQWNEGCSAFISLRLKSRDEYQIAYFMSLYNVDNVLF